MVKLLRLCVLFDTRYGFQKFVDSELGPLGTVALFVHSNFQDHWQVLQLNVLSQIGLNA